MDYEDKDTHGKVIPIHGKNLPKTEGVRPAMRIRLQKDIEKLKSRAIALGTLVEERFRMATKSIECSDMKLARQVIDGDREIDQMEVDIEEEALKVLALHGPVADDLRFLIAVIKLNNDLERIADLAVNVAQRAEDLCSVGPIKIPFDYYSMCRAVEDMLKKSLDALVNTDLALAHRVCAEDDQVDIMKHAMHAQFAEAIKSDRANADNLIQLILVSRHLERIADHATNIAEDVIYLITGEIPRHRGSNSRND